MLNWLILICLARRPPCWLTLHALSLTQALVSLAHGLGMKVVVEGVEDQPCYAAISRLGAEFAQGFGISHPLPAKAFEAWLLAYRAAPSHSARV